MRKIEVPIDTLTEFELGDAAADIQRRWGERKETEREEAERQQIEETEEARMAETPQLYTEEGIVVNRPRSERSDSKINRHKKDI